MNEGCVQQEILLLICTEILVARAFVKKFIIFSQYQWHIKTMVLI